MAVARGLLAAAFGGALGSAALGAAPLVAQAQTGTVTGRVVDSTSNQPVGNVTVRVDGTPLGTLTRDDGTFTIAGVPAGSRTLRTGRVGFAAREVTVAVPAGGSVRVDLALRVLATQLTQVVAVAYGSSTTQTQRNVTGSVAAVDSTLFNKGRVVSPEDLIQAKVAGVQVATSNEPGGAVSVRVRGQASINGVTDPLFVVDGIPLPVGGGLSGGRNPLNFLNPQDIANVTVLKDAQATAIYGSRGANGVVLITTKNGRQQGNTQVSYGANYSNRQVANAPGYLDAQQYRQAVQQYAPGNASLLGNASTDWFDAVSRNGGGQEHNLAIGGTRQDLQYRLSLNYLSDNGVLQGDNTRRVAGAFNYGDRLFGDVLDVQATLRGVRTREAFGGSRYLGDIYGYAPTQPVYNADGTFSQFNNPNAPNNPLSRLADMTDNGQTNRGIGNLQLRANLPFLAGLSATARGSFDVARTNQTTFTPTTDPTQRFANDTLRGAFYQNLPDATTLVLDAFGNYTRRVDAYRTDLDLTAGYSYETFRGNNASFTVNGLGSNALGANGIPSATRILVPAVNVQESRLASVFARANVTVGDRYLLGLSVRRDGSSRFGTNNQWGTFPSGSVGWRLSEEPFLRGRLPGVSDLKLRYSYGINGNQPPQASLYVPYLTFSYSTPQQLVQFGNQYVPVLSPSGFNPNLKWEESATHDVGLDYGLFDGRLTGAVDYYTKRTTNLLFNTPVAAGTNFSNFVLQNVGSLRNAGVEFSLSAGVLRGRGDGRLGRLRYDANFNASANRNRVLRVGTAGGSTQILTGAIGFNNVQVLRPGLPVNTFFVYEAKRGADGRVVADSAADYNPAYYVDQNGDGQINQGDLVPFHNPAPRWILGHTSQFGYGPVDFGFTLRSYLGYYLYNAVAATQGSYSVVQQGGAPRALNEAVLRYGFVRQQLQSSVYVERANFLRMDNVTLGYTVPSRGALRSTRVFGTIQNAFTATGYTGVDPLGFNNSTTANPAGPLSGIDYNSYPLTRIYTLGLTVGF